MLGAGVENKLLNWFFRSEQRERHGDSDNSGGYSGTLGHPEIRKVVVLSSMQSI